MNQMSDQVSTLRTMTDAATINMTLSSPPVRANNTIATHPRLRARSIAITSGKGGVGKSNIAVNVALELATRGRRVFLVDADLALANADVLLGVNHRFHLGHVLSGERRLEDILIKVEKDMTLIPGGSGIETLANLLPGQHAQVLAELGTLEDQADFMILDTASGIATNVVSVLRAAAEVVVVTTPDPTAVVDAYATIKILHQHSTSKPIWILVNEVVGIGEAERIFGQLQSTTSRFLGHPLKFLGMIPRDPELADAVRAQTPVIAYAPAAPASRAIKLIAKHLDSAERVGLSIGQIASSFWHLLGEPLT
jgi:flagellar biosynthesis protein FlhG